MKTERLPAYTKPVVRDLGRMDQVTREERNPGRQLADTPDQSLTSAVQSHRSTQLTPGTFARGVQQELASAAQSSRVGVGMLVESQNLSVRTAMGRAR